MIKLKGLIAVATCCLATGTCPVQACQYNVREVGFIDVGIEPYRLIVYLPENVPASGVSGLNEAMALALAETNIRFEPVTASGDGNQPAVEFARTQGISHFPAAVLVSPDGQSMPVALPEKAVGGMVKAEGLGGGSAGQEGNHRQASLGAPKRDSSHLGPLDAASLLNAAIEQVLKGILESPTRQQILEKCADSYGVVLLIEGPEPRTNTMARETVSAALSRIGAQSESLPKPISKPPELVVLDHKSLAREQVLLWTLRLKAEDVSQPYAAVFYGRGRWIGPLFEGETLTADNLTQLLSIIGADCECSLDHRWLQGTMLPARWDEALQQKVVQSIGFDPESPMTKTEMVSIARRGMGGTGSPNATRRVWELSDYPSVPFDYREIQVGDDAGEGGRQKTAPSSDFPPASSRIVGQVLVGSLAGVAVLAGVTSFVIVLRARKP
jgi:hypothetical protein